MTRAEVLARARSAIGLKTVYKLGAGGFDPKAEHPGLRRGTCTFKSHGKALVECDCSGFGAWGLGTSRWLKGTPLGADYVWFECSNVWRDALSSWGFVNMLMRGNIRPGDIVVEPDRNGKQGHIAIVSQVPGAAGMDWRIIHCSAGNFRKTGDAIQETGLWKPARELTFARVRWVE